MKEQSSDAPDWRQGLQTRYDSFRRTTGRQRTLIHLDAEITVTAADRQMSPESKAEYLEALHAVRRTLLLKTKSNVSPTSSAHQ